MKKSLFILAVVLLFPLSNAHAFTWTSPLAPERGSSGNPINVRITNVNDFRPPAYCTYLPSFLARWSQFSACAPVVAQRNLQSTLTQINNSLAEQNRTARDAQLRPLVFPVRPAPVHVAVAPAAPAQEKAISITFGQPDLWIGAMSERDGLTLTLRVTVVNRGDGDATNVKITPSANPNAVTFNDLKNGSWFIGAIAPGASREYVYKALLGDSPDGVAVRLVGTENELDKNLTDNTETITLTSFSGGGGPASGGSGGGGSL